MGLLQILGKKSKRQVEKNEKIEKIEKDELEQGANIPSPYKVRSVEEELEAFKEQLLSGTFTVKSPNTIRRELAILDRQKAEELQREEIREFNAKYFPHM